MALPVNAQDATDLSDSVQKLGQRVDDVVLFVDIVVGAVGAMAVLIGILVGLGIFRTREYANNLLHEGFLEAKKDEIMPLIESHKHELSKLAGQSQQQLSDIRDQGYSALSALIDQDLKTRLESHEILFREFITMYQSIQEQQLQLIGVKGDELTKALSTSNKLFQVTADITLYLIKSLSHDANDVADACDKLTILVIDGNEALRSRSRSIVRHMYRLVDKWAEDKPRIQILRLIHEIECQPWYPRPIS